MCNRPTVSCPCRLDLIHSPCLHSLAAPRAAAHESRRGGNRSTLLLFAGSLDVCCTGAAIRCAVAELAADDGVRMIPTLRNASDAAWCETRDPYSRCRCTARAASLARRAAGEKRAIPGWARRLPIAAGSPYTAAAAAAAAKPGGDGTRHPEHPYTAMGRAMARSTFCLTPPGDTGVTSRLYSAVAAGCVHVEASVLE